jgi:protein ImuB
VTRLRDFVALPASGVRERFGLEAFRLHQSAAKIYPQRLTQTPYTLPVSERLVFDDAEADHTRLTFAIKSSLHVMAAAMVARGEALTTLAIELTFERRPGLSPSQRRLRTEVSPAAPTLDVVQLSELTRLRLEALQLPAGVTDVLLTATSVPASHSQLGLFAAGTGRDLAAAGRALARLRAELGEDAVVRPVLRDAHLPEAQFAWEPTLSVSAPMAAPESRRRPLVRRFLPAPTPLAAMPRTLRNDGWQPLGPSSGAVVDMQGPYVVSGGWWRREVQRHYYFVTLTSEEIVWIYLDLVRRQWFIQGRVE